MAKGYKTGGRTLGTPNKDNPFKPATRQHSAHYVKPYHRLDQNLLNTIQSIYADREGFEFIAALTLPQLCFLLARQEGDLVSPLELDTALLPPDKRIECELKLANYHSSKMQSTTVDMTLADESAAAIETRLANLAAQNDH